MTLAEAKIIALSTKAKAIGVEVIAMRAHDEWARSCGKGAYTEELYIRCSNELYSLAEQIDAIAINGGLK